MGYGLAITNQACVSDLERICGLSDAMGEIENMSSSKNESFRQQKSLYRKVYFHFRKS